MFFSIHRLWRVRFCAKYGITKPEQKFIESMFKPME